MRTSLLALSLCAAVSWAEAKPLRNGDKAPDAKVVGMDDKSSDLKTLMAGKATVLIFYRGGWCPYCNLHLQDLKNAEAGLLKMGYQLLALSPDRPLELRKTAAAHKLAHTLLSDSDMNAARAYGIVFTVGKETLAKYKEYGIDLLRASGRDHHELPIPSVFIVDREGVVMYIHRDPDYKVRLTAEELLRTARNVRVPDRRR